MSAKLGLWGFRLVLLVPVVLCFALADVDVHHASPAWSVYAVGVVLAGLVLTSFERVSNAGVVVFLFGLWATFVTAGLFAVLEPEDAAEFSNLHQDRVNGSGGDSSPHDVLVGGIVILVLVNLPFLWLLVRAVVGTAPQTGPPGTTVEPTTHVGWVGKARSLVLTGSTRTMREQILDQERRQRARGAKERARRKAKADARRP